MSEHYDSFVVVLDKDIRYDDAQATIAAVLQIKGVLTVTPHTATSATSVATARAKYELGQKLSNAISEVLRDEE